MTNLPQTLRVGEGMRRAAWLRSIPGPWFYSLDRLEPLAARLGLSPNTLPEMVADGKIPVRKMKGRRVPVLFLPDVLRALAEEDPRTIRG